MSTQNMTLNLKIWRQASDKDSGRFEEYKLDNVSPDESFLEMLDTLNEQLVGKGEEPVVFDHDCREGICGTCGLVINGEPHGPNPGITVCQLHMRSFKNGDTLVIEPFRSASFPVLKDLIVDRSSFDRIIASGGYISVSTGSAPDANSLPVSKVDAEEAFQSAACIGCGACVAACKNSSAMLFTSAKLTHLSLLPQGKVEANERVQKMVAQMDAEGFGACTNTGACSATCPKEISLSNIATMNRQLMKSLL